MGRPIGPAAITPPIPTILSRVGPNGEQLAEPVIGGEGMVVAEIDIARSIEQ